MPIVNFLKTSDNTYPDVSADNPLPVIATFSSGDIEIGAVEIKDATTGTRAVVDPAFGLAVDIKRNAALVAGSAIIGKTGIDQTAGQNIVGIQAGTAVIGHIIRDATALTMVHSVATAGLTSTTALAANGSRKYALIVNDSANTVYIFLGTPAVLNTGIRLNANGGSYEMNEANLYTGIITSITTMAAQNMIVTEGV